MYNLKNIIIVVFFFSCCLLAEQKFDDMSIYNIDIIVKNKEGNNIKFQNLAGRVQVFSMIYTNCKTICPIIVSNMKTIEKLLPKDIKDKIYFTLVSLDPDRDDLVSLNKFFVEKKLNDHWHLFRAEKKDILNLALATGIKYKKDISSGEYIHSNLIVLIDKDGIIKYYHQGLDKNFNDIIKLIKKLS